MKDGKVSIIDSTLRDGNHSVNNRFNIEDIKIIVKKLDIAGIDYIEVGYGYGIGSFNDEGYPTDEEIIKAAISQTTISKIAILVFPNKADINEYKKLLNYNLGLVRIAVQASNVEPSREYIKIAKDKGIKVGGFMMMASLLSAQKMADEAMKLKEYGVDSVTITDSAGAMEPSKVEEAIKLVKNKTNLEVGFHTHDNLGLSVGNSVLAIKNGASFVDAAIAGLGAGAGNTREDMLISVLLKEGYKINADMFKAISCVKDLIGIVKEYGVEVKDIGDLILIGHYGIYSTFIKLVNKLSKKYKVNKKEFIEKIAENEFVPGDEKKIEDLAISMGY